MAWSGKVLGGLFGGLVGGPVGLGLGAAIGHVVADGQRPAGQRALTVERLEWRHHGFSPSGPGVTVTPVWRAQGVKGEGVRVDVWTRSSRVVKDVDIDHADEECHIGDLFLPYAEVDEPLEVSVELRADGCRDTAHFSVPLPSPVRRLGLSGPGRVVMACVAAARAGERPLTREDVRFIHGRLDASHELNQAGRAWLRAWLGELRRAETQRLTAEKVAERVTPHLAADGAPDLIRLLMEGARSCWPGEAQSAWIEALAVALGVPPERVRELWVRTDPAQSTRERLQAYETLCLPVGAPVDEVKASWRRLARQFHPDRAISPEQAALWTDRLSVINAAYDTLMR